MSAEDVKEAVRQYAEEHLPGWRTAGVMILVGPVGEDEQERLLVRPATPTPPPSDSPSP